MEKIVGTYGWRDFAFAKHTFLQCFHTSDSFHKGFGCHLTFGKCEELKYNKIIKGCGERKGEFTKYLIGHSFWHPRNFGSFV